MQGSFICLFFECWGGCQRATFAGSAAAAARSAAITAAASKNTSEEDQNAEDQEAAAASKTRNATAKTRRIMLLNDLYTIDDLRTEPGEVRAVLLLDAAHSIFSGHFPGQPVLPGACAIQMVRELLGHALGRDYRLVRADQIKFLSMVDPRDQQVLMLDLHYTEKEEGMRVTAVLSVSGNSCVKLTGVFQLA